MSWTEWVAAAITALLLLSALLAPMGCSTIQRCVATTTPGGSQVACEQVTR